MKLSFSARLFRPYLCLHLLLCTVNTRAQAPAGNLHDSVLQALQATRNDSERLSQTIAYAMRLANTAPAHSISLLRTVIHETKQLELDRLELRAYLNLADIYFDNSDYPRALGYYLDGLRVARSAVQHPLEVDALKAVSIIYMREKDLPRSIQYLKMADSTARYYQISERLPDLMSELGIRYAEVHQYDSAIACYRRSIAMARQMKLARVELNAMVNMAISLKNKGQFSEAMGIYQESLVMAKAQNDWVGALTINDNLANLLYESGKWAESESCALAVLKQADTLSERQDYAQLDMYMLLVKLYEHRGAYPEAFATLKKLSVIKDTLFNDQTARQLQEAGVRFDTELKDNQIATQQADIRYRNRIAIFLGIGITLRLGGGVVSFANQVKVRRLNRQVTVQKGELEQLNAVKDRIFSAISHDIRTPLSSLFSFSRLLSEGNIAPEKLPLYTAQLNGQLSYTLGMMDNLLHWARSQMQGFHPAPVQLDIATLAAEAAQHAAPEAAQKGLTLEQLIPGDLSVRADKEMTALILRNLIHNAIKYTTRGGIITLAGSRAGREVRLSVTDTGIGIDAAAVAAFNTRQGPMESRAGTSGEKGTGLGLLLCKSLAAVMGGRLELDSQPGQGSCFTLVLPANTAGDNG